MFEKELEKFDLTQIKITENLIRNYLADYSDAYIFQNIIKYTNIHNDNCFVSVMFGIDKKLDKIELYLTKTELLNLDPDFLTEISTLGDVTILALKCDPIGNTYEIIVFNPGTMTLIEKFNYLIFTSSYWESHMMIDIFLTIS